MNKTKLIKLLAMMGSTHDGEVLTAARMAHKMVTAAGMTWDRVIEAPKPIVEPPVQTAPASEYSKFSTMPKPQKVAYIKELMRELYKVREKLSPASVIFIAGLESHLQLKGDLTDKQVESLCQTYARYCEKRAA